MRRGLTLLETVLAVALLSMVALSVFGAINYCVGAHERGRQRLACAELANRLMLIYMDDDDELRQMPRALEYAGERFAWSVREAFVDIRPAKEDQARAAQSLDRFKNVTIEVWLGEESGGESRPTGSAPAARLVRMLDPVPLRNVDSLSGRLSDEAKKRAFIDLLTNGRRSGARRPAGSSPGSGVGPPASGAGGAGGSGASGGSGGSKP